MKEATMYQLNEKYKDCPTRTNEYTIEGKKYIVKSHFVGSKNLNEVLYRLAFAKALKESLSPA